MGIGHGFEILPSTFNFRGIRYAAHRFHEARHADHAGQRVGKCLFDQADFSVAHGIFNRRIAVCRVFPVEFAVEGRHDPPQNLDFRGTAAKLGIFPGTPVIMVADVDIQVFDFRRDQVSRDAVADGIGKITTGLIHDNGKNFVHFLEKNVAELHVASHGPALIQDNFLLHAAASEQLEIIASDVLAPFGRRPVAVDFKINKFQLDGCQFRIKGEQLFGQAAGSGFGYKLVFFNKSAGRHLKSA